VTAFHDVPDEVLRRMWRGEIASSSPHDRAEALWEFWSRAVRNRAVQRDDVRALLGGTGKNVANAIAALAVHDLLPADLHADALACLRDDDPDAASARRMLRARMLLSALASGRTEQLQPPLPLAALVGKGTAWAIGEALRWLDPAAARTLVELASRCRELTRHQRHSIRAAFARGSKR
jgi:hypothetical protein